ncbi:MAG: adenosylmethionine--8-amino-7-oxononanoate transaminase [Planctomycetaceae bacterium]|nr:adenosylmethionine--8-amino-7-oxononanoate transaminase [Planctomycetaceae bacterium]
MHPARINELVALDHQHVWHPFTPMRQWRESNPLIIESGDGDCLIDAHGNRYIDGVSSIWCNVHGHRVRQIDQAIRDQLDRIAHTTMLGLTHEPAVDLARRLCNLAPGHLNKVFYSDAGATAVEIAFKMAVGYWHHTGQPQRNRFIGIRGAYHGDTTGSMSVGYDETFHRPFKSMVFETDFVPAPDPFHTHRPPEDTTDRRWALEHPDHCAAIKDHALQALDQHLSKCADRTAAIVVEPLVQGAAGLIVHPPGYLADVADLARRHHTLLIADEVATGFGRTGAMFAADHEHVAPDILCLGKGLTGGYLPLAATLATDTIEQAFTGEIHEHRTLYHGHTYTGNPLACAAALASLDLFESTNLIEHVNRKAELLAQHLNPLRDASRFPYVGDVRQRGLMAGIELTIPGTDGATGFDPSRRWGADICRACRDRGIIIRPLGNVIVLMPPLAIRDENLIYLTDTVVSVIADYPFE